MINPAALRTRLHDRITQAERQKLSGRRPTKAGCIHDFEKSRLNVVPSRPNGGAPFLGTGAYVIVGTCTQCEGKRLFDYVVER